MKRQIMKTVALMALLLATNLYASADDNSANDNNVNGKWEKWGSKSGTIRIADLENTMSFNSLSKHAGSNFSTRYHDGTPYDNYDLHFNGNEMGICFNIFKYTLKVEPHTITQVELGFDIIAALYDTNLDKVYSLTEIASIDGTFENAKAQKLWVNPKTDPQKDPHIVCYARCNQSLSTTKISEGSKNGLKATGSGKATVTFDNRNGSDWKVFERYFIMVFSGQPTGNVSTGHTFGGLKKTPTLGTPTITKRALTGDGSQNNPFLITNADDLIKFRNMVNNANHPDYCAKLTADIDMGNSGNWIPICRFIADSDKPYTGIFNGDGYTISNLHSDIDSFKDKFHDTGLIGRSGAGCVVKNLLMNNVSLKGRMRSAPIVGQCSGKTTIENCGVLGKIELSLATTISNGLDGLAYGGTLNFCYTTFPAKSCIGGSSGYGHGYSTKKIAYYYGESIEKMLPGELCYKLNDNSSLQPVWYQDLKTMKYPIQNRGKGKKVHKTGDIYHNGKMLLNGTGSETDPFIIVSGSGLNYFRDLVDQGCTGICASLAADIDYTAYKADTNMIGTDKYRYKGIFNGNGKNVKIDFSTQNNETGLFRYVEGATIGNLHLLGSIQGDGRQVGSLIGVSYGNTKVTHVISDVDVICNFTEGSGFKKDAAWGGLIAGVCGAISIDYSAFRGSYSIKQADHCSGFIGWIFEGGSASIANSYFAPQAVDNDNADGSYTFAPDVYAKALKLTNCYYTKQFRKAQGEKLTTDQMKNGEGCYKLNGSSNDKVFWLQTLGQDDFPTLWNARRVYKLGDIYTNAECKLPGAGTLADPLLIGSATDLEYFRDLVNDYNLPSLCARLTADIDMRDRDWIPIGRWTTDNANPKVQVAYTGTLDGDGFIISDLSGSSAVDHDMGLIGRGGEGCTVMSLIMDNVHLKSANYSAPIIGYATKSCTVEYCGIKGLVKLEQEASHVGGIVADENKCVTMNGCYTVFSTLRPGVTTDDATNHNYCNVGSKTMTATGELCYKLNGDDGKSYNWLQTIGKDPYPMQRTGGKVGKKDSKYGNIDFTDDDNSVFSGTLGSSDLKIIHHGGHLYEFIVTLGTKDGLGYHPFPDMKLYYKENGSWIDIATLKNINREKLPFNKDWSGEITISKGTFYDAHTFETQPPVFWIMQGNHSSKKAASLLWLAPKDLKALPEEFMVESTTASPVLQMSNKTTKTTAPTGANAVTVVEPYPNALAANLPGSAASMIVSPSMVYSLGLWDATDDKFISMQEITAGTNSINVTMPQQECVHNLVALMYAQNIAIVGLEVDTTYVTYGVPFSQKPLHSIWRTNSSILYDGSNTIKWSIAFPKDSDIIAGDQFTVYRASQSDFSDATTLTNYNIEDFTSTASAGDTLAGWFAYTDTTAGSILASVKYDSLVSAFDKWNLNDEAKKILTAYKHPASYIYYGVQRATATALWSNANKYWKTWEVLLNNVLPRVDTIRVVKTDNWNTTHKVELRLTLNNPYPYALVPSSYKQAVIDEAQAHDFPGRMFLWDENAKIVITRYCPRNEWHKGVDEVAETITIKGSDVKQDSRTGNYYAVVTDIQSAPKTHYYYRAKVDNSDSKFQICSNMTSEAFTTDAEANACYSEILAKISNFKASRGTDIGLVNLSWDADNAASLTYTLKKSVYAVAYDAKATDPSTEILKTSKGNAQDSKAGAGKVYQYDLTRTMKFRDSTYTDKATAYGWSDFRHGSISGRVTMADGTVIPGDVYVTITPSKAIELNAIKSPDGKEVIMPSFKRAKDSIEIKVDSKGFYHIDTLPYYGAGVKYTVKPRCGVLEFKGSTGEGAMEVTLEDACYSYEDVNFVCSKTKQFSGRILYEGSTVPARGIGFKVNEMVLMDKDDNPVTTDAMGNFSFSLPIMRVSIQAFKSGHNLKGDGYILGGTNKDQKEFTPESADSYDGLLLYDKTKVRLVGRVVGGNAEGSKPVGFGLSTNNLGDNITLMLQLEGDNTSYIYYNAKNPDETSKEEMFFQRVFIQKDNKDIDSVATANTIVTSHSKRIVIKADNATGEFCIDLFPTKYKVSQLTAQGYSTLYREGEGLQTIDLTNESNDMRYGDDKKTIGTIYAAAFNHVYHSEAKVTLTQEQPKNDGWVGDSLISVTTVFGRQSGIQTAWKDKDGIHYTFGHPVFQGGEEYTFTVKAVEEYHYNNVPTGSLSTSPLANDSLVIINGLTSGNQIIRNKLNSAGKLSFTIKPSNTTFSFTGEDALFNLSAAVQQNGWSYESEPIKGYVTGIRDMGLLVQAALESKPTSMDIIRDPYGSGSYAYREKGTTYTWSQHFEENNTRTFNLNASFGFSIVTNVGLGVTTGYQIDVPAISVSLNRLYENNYTYKDGEYTITLNDRITTSSDPLDVGAMADLYIGNVKTMDIRKSQVFTVLDNDTYTALSDAVKSGALKTVCKGTDKNGKEQYLIVGQGMDLSEGTSRLFIYSQKYIIGTLIPELERQRDLRKRTAKTKEDAQNMADETGLTYYYMENDTTYSPCYSSSSQALLTTDTVQLYDKQIEQWKNLIKDNEKQKYDALYKNKLKLFKSYSITQSVIEHTEEASSYYCSKKAEGSTYSTVSQNHGAKDSPTDKTLDRNISSSGDQAVKNAGGGILIDFSAGRTPGYSVSNTFSNNTVTIGGSGFCLSTPDNGVIDMDIYKINDENLVPIDKQFQLNVNSYENGTGSDGFKRTDGKSQGLYSDSSSVHNYIFVQRGGSTRNPWSDADSTYYYKPNGKREPLGARTMRIDNPKIYVENPVVNNQPQDEPAVFTIRLANETEINENTKYLNPSTLYLNVDEPSNPYGAKLTIDGQPLRNHMEFYLNPGQSAVKTLEVERGGKPYDYENIKLQFTDNPDLWSLCDEATISVHYQPVSSPVNLSLPADNWLMNTLSQKDDNGNYYIPVQIDGFSTTKYDNFDHIELQYKKQTEGEDQWVNLCSYYAFTSEGKKLYANATGKKDYIYTDGKIENIKFYGEKDPIEMKYDLRAVSFCRLGTGYITRYSKVVSGTKDTRCPEVFGKPSPADGILEFDDVISLPFTEPIAYNYLDETVNFSVQGYTNNSDADHSAYIRFPGSTTQDVSTKVTREIDYHDFTVEMMVKVENSNKDKEVRFFTIGTNAAATNDCVAFGYKPDEDCLTAFVGGTEYKSVKLSSEGVNLNDVLTHVAFTYSAKDNSIQSMVGSTTLLDIKGINRIKAKGRIYIGHGLKGSMADIRMWTCALSELTRKYDKSLSPKEKNLYAYWPMKEAKGNMICDITNGADLYLTDVAWQTPVGYSLRINNNNPAYLTQKGCYKFGRSYAQDYTLSFWFRADASVTSDKVMLFSAGSDGLAEKGVGKMRIGFVKGELQLISEGNTIPFGATASALAASVWHNIAVSVNHSLNTVSLFIDGTMVNEASADMVGGISNSEVKFGGGAFSGNIDNITLWSIALPAYYINEGYNTDLTGRELELLVNLNFEQQLKNEQGTLYVGFSPMNNVIVKSTGEIAGDTLVTPSTVVPDGAFYAPVRSGSGLQNIPFTWTSTENALQINIKKADADINHRQLNLVVRNVEDINGNQMENAAMWSVYMNRNILEWDKSQIEIDLPYGSGSTATATWKNKSGRPISYKIETEAVWLKLSETMGTMDPLASGSVDFEISEGLSPGNYMTYVYLTDEDNLVSKMTVSVKVTAEAPDWNVVNGKDYPSTMQVIACVKKKNASGNWITDMSKQDIVAAFIDTLCLGKASLTIDETANTSHLFLNIHGNTKLNEKKMEFRLWDASTTQTYILETGTTNNGVFTKEDIKHVSNSIKGSDNPYEMRVTTSKMQTLNLSEGWNWVSFNVKPSTQKGLNNLFCDCDGFDKDDILTRNGSNFATYQGNGKWSNQLDNLVISQNNVYQIFKQQAGTVSVGGTAFEDGQRTVTLSFNDKNKWSELAYLLEVTQPIGIALSDFTATSSKAPVGTIIKSHDCFAIAREDGHWFGSLEYMRPGEGYFVYRKENGTITISYTNTTVQATTKASIDTNNDGSWIEEEAARAVKAQAVGREYSQSMPVIAAFAEGTWQRGDILVALVNGEMVGTAQAITDERNGQPYFFLSVCADEGTTVRFVKVRDGEVVGESRNSLTFNGTSIVGTLESPYLIDFTETVVEGVYDATGIKYPDEEYLQGRHGVFIINGRKVVR